MTPEKPLTARQITIALYWSLRSASDLLLPRYTPKDWWECDLWRLTKAGFVDEYEIKLSVADFRADTLKSDGGRLEYSEEEKRWVRAPERKKHDLLAGNLGGPNRFWYVMPAEIAEKVEIPRYAGLMICSRRNVSIRVQAPRRHVTPWAGDRLQVLKTFYHRYWSHEAGAKTDAPIAAMTGEAPEA